MKLTAPTINEIVNHPNSFVERNRSGMHIYIRYTDAFKGEKLSDEKIKEQLENARFSLGVFKYQRQGLRMAQEAFKKGIELIEYKENNASKRYQLLKYLVSRLVEDSEKIISDRAFEDFRWDFVKEKGKLTLKPDYNTHERALMKLLEKKLEAYDESKRILDLENEEN